MACHGGKVLLAKQTYSNGQGAEYSLAPHLCHDGDSGYQLVAYRGSPYPTALPAVFGASDLLVPLD